MSQEDARQQHPATARHSASNHHMIVHLRITEDRANLSNCPQRMHACSALSRSRHHIIVQIRIASWVMT